MKPFYVTTPIYYVNDRPHIGHAYSTVAADMLSRYHRLRGEPVRFLTGLDEHGLKIERKAREVDEDPQAFVDAMTAPWKQAWVELRCETDDFIRTTEPRHKERAQALWERLETAGDVYLADYEDWYCVGCESFKTEKELLPGNLCPDHKRPVERVREESYFFRLSKYTDRLLAFYEANPGFVRPEGRFNEVKSFVREGLRDLSISRTSFQWGIPVPRDPKHVMYVWLDALTNYLSALGGPAPEGEAPLYDEFWNGGGRILHIVGKDILRFHTVYWPAFLMSAGIRTPDQVWAHGWLTVNGEKMSKSLGNFLPPGPLVEAFGADVLRYYFLREVGFGQDGDFSHANLIARYNGELANGLGNLLNRMLASIVKKSLGGEVPRIDLGALRDEDRALVETAKRAAAQAAKHLEEVAPHRALESVFELVAAANRYVDGTEPWRLAKEGDGARLAEVAYCVLESLRFLSVMLWPFMPDKCDGLRAQLGLPKIALTEGEDQWPSAFGELPAGTTTAPGAALFPRIDEDREKAILEGLGVAPKPEPQPQAKKAKPSKGAKETKMTKTAAELPEGLIAFDDFAKVELKLARVLVAERVPKSDRLLRLEVECGEAEPRQILAGIAAHYAPEDLVGRSLVIVANLAPRKMMGLESQGMVLAASDEGGLSVLGVDKAIAPGTKVS
jgi:methionyl-tRNA synthetase